MPRIYLWYEVVRSRSFLQQGDIFFKFPLYLPKYQDNLNQGSKRSRSRVAIDKKTADVIVMSQSCDLETLEKGADPTDAPIILCPIFGIKEQISSGEMEIDQWEGMVKEQFVSSRIINSFKHRWHKFEYQRVLLKQIYAVPFPFLRTFANKYGTRVRLLPPYREHLAQAFARQFMRVGLPNDLPRECPYSENDIRSGENS